VVLAAIAAPAAAQQEGHGQHAQGMQSMGNMQGMEHCTDMMGGPPPAMVLQYQEELGLWEDQVSRLETLRDEAGAQAHMPEVMAAHARAAEALDANRPDWATYEAALRSAADHMVQAHTAMARTAVAAKDVLTPAQREQLSGMDHGMSGMMGNDGAGQMGMMGCMMMGGMNGMEGHGAGGAGHGH
jgi:Spy/CpxP family protein refolding chaperone